MRNAATCDGGTCSAEQPPEGLEGTLDGGSLIATEAAVDARERG